MKVALTFDDGYLSHHDIVMPLLLERGFGGSFYITGDMISSPPRVPSIVKGAERTVYTYFMTWPEVKAMHDAGFEMGSHLKKHVDMTLCDDKELHEFTFELHRDFSEYRIPHPETLSYPGFHVDDRVKEFLSTHGYRYARSGCEKSIPFDDFQSGAKAVEFDGSDPMAVNCSVIFGDRYKPAAFERDLPMFDGDLVLCFHDIRNDGTALDITVDEFKHVLKVLEEAELQVVALRELEAQAAA